MSLKNVLKKIFASCGYVIYKIGTPETTLNNIESIYKSIGISNYSEDPFITGEGYVVEKILPKYISKKPIFFDVGANVGDYSKLLYNFFSEADIYSFEPHTETFNTLKKTALPIHYENKGLSSKEGTKKLFHYEGPIHSGLASVYGDTLKHMFSISESIQSSSVVCTTIDIYTDLNKIGSIDFLKIDTEGHEFEVLQGAKKIIESKGVKIIQFEFNEHNIFSRVFLKDFFEYLKTYNFYRIDTGKLIPMKKYRPSYEIFRYQNILAISSDLDKEFQ